MTPYLASAGWYAQWLRGISAGMTDMDAQSVASKACCLKGKDFARCRIVGNGAEMMLSIPVEGGASRLKRLTENSDSDKANIAMSEHGNWRHAHMGALQAVYGRTPYFPHIMPMLEEVYNSVEKSLEIFNDMIHKVIVDIIFGADSPADIFDSIKRDKRFFDRGRELELNVSPDISVVALLMQHGKESLLPLLSPSTLNSQP